MSDHHLSHLDGVRARAAANVAVARARAGLADPAAAAAHHAAVQAHVPRMVGWLNDVTDRAMWAGNRAGQIDALARNARADNARLDAAAMTKFRFDVTFATSKDAIMAGDPTRTHRVVVLGRDAVDARLAAEQLVAATGGEPVAVSLA